MKGLEIVNKWVIQLEGIKIFIEEDNNNGYSWFNYEKLYKYLEYAKTIKQELEALEILKNKFHLDIIENGYYDCIDLSYDSVNPDNLPKEEYELIKELMNDDN